MGMVSSNFMHTNDVDKHIINWYTHNTGGETMIKEAVITHFVMFILGCVTMYMMVNYL